MGGEGGLEQEFNLVVNICVGEAGGMGLWKEDFKFCFFQEYLKVMKQAFIPLSVIFLCWADFALQAEDCVEMGLE